MTITTRMLNSMTQSESQIHCWLELKSYVILFSDQTRGQYHAHSFIQQTIRLGVVELQMI